MATALTLTNGSIEAREVTSVDRQLLNMPEAPGDTVEIRGWAAFDCTLSGVDVYCATVNTQGTYTLTITNVATGNTVLNAASFDMNSLTADTVTQLTLTSTSTDLDFSARDRWTVSLASNNASLDAAGVYVSLDFTSV